MPTSSTSPAVPSVPKVVKAVRTNAPLVPANVQSRALDTTAKYIHLAEAIYRRTFHMPNVAFDLRGKTAGMAYCSRNLIRYNAILLTENLEAFEARTIPHEVAHLVARTVFGEDITSHGPEWQSVMVAFGAPTSRCHSYDVSKSAVGKSYTFVCNCGKEFELSSRKSTSARAGRLICRACKGKLRPRILNADETSSHRAAAPRPTTEEPSFSRKVETPDKVPRPSEAMLKFAKDIASKLGIALMPEHLTNASACSDFIRQFKNTSGSIASARRLPTEKQIQYAVAIAKRKGLSLPAEVLVDAKKISLWISENH